MSSINEGDVFSCKKTVYLNYDKDLVCYKKGKIYKSHNFGCITDEFGNRNHSWEYPTKEFKKLEKKDFTNISIGHCESAPIGQKFSNDKLPYDIVLFKQFPNALQEVIKCSKAGHEKYKETDTDWQNFLRVEDAEQKYKDAALRHKTESGIIEDMIPFGEMTHEAAVVWNSLAALEIKLRKEKGLL